MMADRRLSLILTISMLGAAPFVFAQAPAQVPAQASAEGQRPTFAGTWTPSEPARSSAFFDSGMGWIPGNGRLVIEQRSNRITVTKHVPDDILDPLLAIHEHFYPTVIYRVGASSWQGNRLVLSQSRTGIRLITVSLSLDGDRLKHESHTVIVGEGKESTVAEWFARAK